MLEFDDIQHILLARAPALTGRYEFLSFRDAAGGRQWLASILDKVQSVAAMRASVDNEKRWVTVAFTWRLRALADDAPLATFQRVQAGMVARLDARTPGKITRIAGSEDWPARTCMRS